MTTKAKATTKRKRSKKNTKGKKKTLALAVVANDPHPSKIETQVLVWDAYQKHRSVVKVVADTGVSEWIVRGVLDSDKQRLATMMTAMLERMVSDWEEQHDLSQKIITKLLAMTQVMLDEINKAAVEGRLTTIRNDAGFPMPVLDAIQYVIMGRTLDQVLKVAAQAQAISAAFRAPGQTPATTAGGGEENLDGMDDMMLLKRAQDVGVNLPPIIQQKVKLLERKMNAVDSGK